MCQYIILGKVEIEDAITEGEMDYAAAHRIDTATHEAWHVIISYLKKVKIESVTITPQISPSGKHSLGRVSYDCYAFDTAEKRAAGAMVSLGGFVAGKLFGVDSEGATGDIGRASEDIRILLTDFGASPDYGYIDYNSFDSGAAILNMEIAKMSQRLQAETKALLEVNLVLVERLRDELLVRETMTGDEVFAFLDGVVEELKSDNA